MQQITMQCRHSLLFLAMSFFCYVGFIRTPLLIKLFHDLVFISFISFMYFQGACKNSNLHCGLQKYNVRCGNSRKSVTFCSSTFIPHTTSFTIFPPFRAISILFAYLMPQKIANSNTLNTQSTFRKPISRNH